MPHTDDPRIRDDADLTTEDLLKRAAAQAERNHESLLHTMSDLFITAETRLTDRERSLMMDILGKLLAEAEIAVRTALAERLRALESAPAELVELVANDDIEVARPLLLHSRLLRDAQLIAIAERRSREHAFAIAKRTPLSAPVSDALVARNDADIIEALLENPSAGLSRAALAYVVAEAERFDRFREPLVRRADLPRDLALRLYWHVSAAWRRHILDRFESFPVKELETALEGAARQAASLAGQPTAAAADGLAAELDRQEHLGPRFVIRCLRDRRVPAACGAIARLSRVKHNLARRILVGDGGGESLAILARGAGFDRDDFGRLHLLAARFNRHSDRAESELNDILAFYDQLPMSRAEAVLATWNRERDFAAAIAALDDRGEPQAHQMNGQQF